MSYEMSESSAMAGGSKKIETSTYEPGRYTAKVIPYSSDTKHGSIQSSFYLMGQPSDVTIKKGESASFSVGNIWRMCLINGIIVINLLVRRDVK